MKVLSLLVVINSVVSPPPVSASLILDAFSSSGEENDSAVEFSGDSEIVEDRGVGASSEQRIRQRSRKRIRGPSIQQRSPTQSCEIARDEDDCNDIDDCSWLGDSCYYKQMESCGFAGDADGCSYLSDCVWMSEYDPRDDRPTSDGTCASKQEVEGSCSMDGYAILSEDLCNSVKGCSWRGGDASKCSPALTQTKCNAFGDEKDTCKQEGCIFRKMRRKKVCLGRWESEFLSSLKKREGEKAMDAIKDEYGEDTYKVTVYRRTDKKPRKYDGQRIKLYLNNRGNVRHAKFG